MAASETNGRRRISVELPDSLVTRLDELKDEWGLRARGDCLTRLLEEIFNAEDEPSEVDDDTQELTQNSNPISDNTAGIAQRDNAPAHHSSFNEDRALVLIGRGSLDVECNVEAPPATQPRSKGIGSSKGGIDLPGFVRQRTTEIRESLRAKPPEDSNNDAPLMPAVSEKVLKDSTQAAEHHWLTLYGKPAGETVLEAAMTWLGRDIWPNADGCDGRTFTWSQTQRLMQSICPGWLDATPRFAQVIVVAGVLEDPFASSELVHRIPTLIRRFVNRFKRSRKVTSFETLESTMTVHGALKLLQLPTTAGASLTLKMIREAYKTQALETHPDAGGSTEAMRRLNEAYQMLRELYRQKD